MQAALGGEAFDLLENGLLAVVETGFDGGQLFQIGLRLEGLGDFLFQIVDEPTDLLGEGRPAAGRQRAVIAVAGFRIRRPRRSAGAGGPAPPSSCACAG